MKDFARQLFTNLAPAIACLSICAWTQLMPISTTGHGDDTVILLPKIESLDSARVAMLTAQKNRYTAALRDYQAALSQAPVSVEVEKSFILRGVARDASDQYRLVAEETADGAFRVSGLPRELPRQ